LPLLDEWAGEYAAHNSAPVDEVGGGQSQDAVAVAYFAVSVNRDREFHPEFLCERTNDAFPLLQIDAKYDQSAVSIGVVCINQLRDFLAARLAPGGPEVDDHRLSAQVAEAHLASVEGLQEEVRSQLALLGADFHRWRHEGRREISWSIFLAAGRRAWALARFQPPDDACYNRDGEDRHDHAAPDSTRR